MTSLTFIALLLAINIQKGSDHHFSRLIGGRIHGSSEIGLACKISESHEDVNKPELGFPLLLLEVLLNVLQLKGWGGLRGIRTFAAGRGKSGQFGDDMGKLPSRAVRGKRRTKRDMGPRPAHILRNL
jgi:hypothetical protein